MRGPSQGGRRSVDRGTGRPGIELRNQSRPGCRRRSAKRKATSWVTISASRPVDPAQSETPGMPGNSMRENRETPSASGSEYARTGWRRRRAIRPACTPVGSRTISVVPTKRPNNDGATVGGGRGGKAIDQGEHRGRPTRARTQSREQRVPGTCEVCGKQHAGTSGQRFTALLHHVNGRSAAGQLLRR